MSAERLRQVLLELPVTSRSEEPRTEGEEAWTLPRDRKDVERMSPMKRVIRSKG